jgi:hypothetical protein
VCWGVDYCWRCVTPGAFDAAEVASSLKPWPAMCFSLTVAVATCYFWARCDML